MTELTFEEALGLVALGEVMAWTIEVRGTLRFHDDDGQMMLRLAVHTDEANPEHIDVALVPVADDTATSLALALRAAQDVIAPQIRRRALRAVPSA